VADAHGAQRGALGVRSLKELPDIRLLPDALRRTVDEWSRTRWEDLRFSDARGAVLVCAALLAIVLLVLLIRVVQGRRAGRTHIALPALLPVMRVSPLSAARYAPALLFVIGVPLFAMALADPHTGFTREEVSYPGRRIALLVDASTSMVMSFKSTTFKTQGESTFFTAVAGAEAFIQRRMKGPYRDVVALIQFGNQAYVVTPFTTDYENILLSVRLISDPREWGRFSDWGTTIIEGIDQATQLFKAFNFINASGNLMVVFTDGRDSELNRAEKPLDKLVNEARTLKIPVHMIRTAYNYRFGEVPQDKIWKPVVERTGGRFYAVYDDESLSRALLDIDRLSPGRIETREYSVQRPRFSAYALAAVTLWMLAALLKLGVPVFRTFP
jgi:hypothetical protein